MLRINNRGFKRSYVYGGTGIFDSIAKTISSVLGKQAIKQAATQVVQKAATEAGKKLGEKGVKKVSSLISKSRDKPSVPSVPSGLADLLDSELSSPRLTSKSQDILRKYTTLPPPIEEEFNLNNLIAGSAIRIEDYIKRWK